MGPKAFSLSRRAVLTGTATTAIMLAALPAHALTDGEARALVEKTLDELLSVLKRPGSPAARAPELRKVMESRANMPLIAKFSAGRIWREMNDDQQGRYSSAFSKFVSVTYSRRFDEIKGDPKVRIGKVQDAGRKGMLVETPLSGPQGETISVEWLVSDRGGRVEIIDLVVEGISMATTQREEIAAMFEKRGNDVEALISDLNSAT